MRYRQLEYYLLKNHRIIYVTFWFKDNSFGLSVEGDGWEINYKNSRRTEKIFLFIDGGFPFKVTDQEELDSFFNLLESYFKIYPVVCYEERGW